jgi:hypothetical protein
MGVLGDTKYTAEISTRNPVFVYTGANFEVQVPNKMLLYLILLSLQNM